MRHPPRELFVFCGGGIAGTLLEPILNPSGRDRTGQLVERGGIDVLRKFGDLVASGAAQSAC